MMTYTELWDGSLQQESQPGVQQEFVASRFGTPLIGSPISFYDPATPPPEEDTILLGFAHYVRDELVLLDSLITAAHQRAMPQLHVFNFGALRTMEQAEHCFGPAVPAVPNSPFLIIRRDNRVRTILLGVEARTAISAMLSANR